LPDPASSDALAAPIELMGLSFQPLDEDGVIRHIVAEISDDRGGWLVNPNTDVLRRTYQSDEIRKLVSQATLRIADGVPLLWLSRIAGLPLRHRVAGTDLISSLSEAATMAGIKIVLLGGRDAAIAEAAAAAMKERYPNGTIAAYSPPFGFEKDDEEMQKINLLVATNSPAIIFCGVGFPKQEYMMLGLQERFKNCWFIGSGASIDLVAGKFRRAPEWMQRAGLEWLYRLALEPRRLFRRYIIDDLPFLARGIMWAAGQRLRLR
jgi:N-acetylglucosaminyldiphosphoundecaprenol N-acetyl-beta-D-mannosaminyltransferase